MRSSFGYLQRNSNVGICGSADGNRPPLYNPDPISRRLYEGFVVQDLVRTPAVRAKVVPSLGSASPAQRGFRTAERLGRGAAFAA